MLLKLKRLAGPERVKEVDDEEAEVALQPLDVGVGAMEDLWRRMRSGGIGGHQ